jgi:hypothetical protein
VQTALRSILQSAFDMTRLEIIGVGDTQAEQAWSSILAEHPTEARTRWIRMGTESPPATRLNRGLEAATAPLTFLTDGDSCLEETCLQRHVEGIRAEAGTEAAWASWLEITEEGRQIITARTKQPFTYKTLLHTPPLGLNAIFDTARLRSLGGFDERLNEPALTSHELWLRMSHAQCRLTWIEGGALSFFWSGSDAWSRRQDFPNLFEEIFKLRRLHPASREALLGTKRYLRYPGISRWFAQLYFETAEGERKPYDPDRERRYSEADSLVIHPHVAEKTLHFVLDAQTRTRSLRFDPLDRPVRIRLLDFEVSCQGKRLEITPAFLGNGDTDGQGTWTFTTDDPAILIDFPEQDGVAFDECLLTVEWLDEIFKPQEDPTQPMAPSDDKPDTPEASAHPNKAGLDYGLTLPFRFPTWPGVDTGRLAVLCHAFHPDLMPEIRAYLEHIPGPFDLFLTIDDTRKASPIRDAFRNWKKGQVEIRTFENRGRDVAPKLLAWPEIYRSHDLMLHIHTKKTQYNSYLFRWRKYLFDNLMGSKTVVRNILQLFALDERLGMVAPLHFHALNISDPMAGNYDDVRSLAARMGLDIPRTAPLDFPAGSMFWARTATLRPLLDTGIQLSEFPEEAGQVDGTLAHAVERLYFVSCEAAGLHWVKVVQRSQFPEAAYGLDIADMHELSRALIAYRRDRQMLPFG